MNYWKWLGKGLLHAINFGWVISILKSPIGEALGGTAILSLLSSILIEVTGNYWWTFLYVLCLLVFTHGIYRSSEEEGK